jgi:transcriptional regulator with XRE-family HTH domain
MTPALSARTRTPRIGPRLRTLRVAHNLTLEQVAEGAGLTKGFVSRVERDQTSVSIAALQRICDVLQTPVGALFDSPPRELVTAGEAPLIEFSAAGLRQLVLSPTGVTDLHVVKVLLSPGGDATEEVSTATRGTTFIHVLRGMLSVDLEGERFELGPGDSFTFSGRAPYTYHNASPREHCEALLAVAPEHAGTQGERLKTTSSPPPGAPSPLKAEPPAATAMYSLPSMS